MNYSKRNLVALVIALSASITVIAVFSVFAGNTSAGELLTGYQSAAHYPFTLQNLMNLFLFIGLGQIWVRWLSSHEENVFLKLSGFLPEDENTVLSNDSEIDAIRANVNNITVRADAFLPDLINTCSIQYLKSHTVSDTLSVLNSALDLHIHRLELRYSFLRYIIWAIPTFGFIGTVVGISNALSRLDIVKFMGAHMDKVAQFRALTMDLGFAFGTTIIALIHTAILVFLIHLVQKHEEEALNSSARYVLNNFINRLSSK
jgi:biopolymer transport protein ExbB/TolQ